MKRNTTKNKRRLCFLATVLLIAALLAGCGRGSAPSYLSPEADSATTGQNGQGGATSGDNTAAGGGAAGTGAGNEAAAGDGSSVLVANPVTSQEYDFSLGFAGDICFADNYIPLQHLAAIGSDDIADGIDPAYIELMRGMDLMWINNEFVYSDRGEPLDGKAWTFRGATANVRYLDDLGVDIAGLANNHVYDYGADSFLDTLTTLENANIPYVGAGRDLNAAKAPVYLETNGFTIAYVAAERAEFDWVMFTPQATETEGGILHCYDNTLFLESIREAKKNADFVIALPHWGLEHTTELEDVQIDGARAYIDAGADAVIGAHPHILQGMEYYKGKPILYSLGNFWFDDYDIDTMVAELRLRGTRKAGREGLADAEVKLILHPGTQSGAYTKMADTEEWRDRIFRHLEDISFNISIADDGTVAG